MMSTGKSLILLGLLAGLVHAQGHGSPVQDPDHWAFQPLQRPTPPEVQDREWSHNPIDRFVLDRLRREGIEPAPRADRRTLLRRATFTLLGLPPSVEQLDEFLADPRDTDVAFAAVVEELLASPHYGERWARHWLDLARYSDSNGLDENLAFGNAWRYRDWVVKSLNADMSYRQFATLQLAGDQVPEAATDPECLVATGFLALGPRMLAEQDKDKLQLDVVDEQVDLVGRTFLGLTIGCARCHDHKFDPVPTSDYYALAGIFRSTRNFEHTNHVSAWLERPLESAAESDRRKELQSKAKDAEAALASAEADITTVARGILGGRIDEYLGAAEQLRARMLAGQAEAATRTNLRSDSMQWGSPECVILHSAGDGLQFAEYEVEPRVPGPHRLVVRYAASESRPMRLLLDGKLVADKVLRETTGGWNPAHQAWHEVASVDLGPGTRRIRLERKGAVPHLDQWLLVPEAAVAQGLPVQVIVRMALDLERGNEALLQPWRGEWPGENDAIAATDVAGRLAAELSTDGTRPEARSTALAVRYRDLFSRAANQWVEARAREQDAKKAVKLPDPLLDACAAKLFGKGGWMDVSAADLAVALPGQDQEYLNAARREAEQARAAIPPAPPTAMCVRDDSIVDLPVMSRGNHLAPAPQPTPRGFLSVTAGLVAPPVLPKDRSGRLELAQWMFDPEHPLTSRVMVSRIWQGHFGQGLVRSPSNVGPRGDKPSHPELLDWLAREFQAQGWSLKAMHRLVLGSRTWQQQVVANPAAALKDPDNRLHWSQYRRRLDAESARDAVLAVAGTLDRTLGGDLLQAGNRSYVTNDQSGNRARYDAPRRALYLPIIRNAMYDWFTAFDYGDPSVHIEQRPASATALQALQLMNSPMVMAQADAMATRLAKGTDEERIRSIWRQALLRDPEPEEQATARVFLGTGEPTDWSRLCHAVICTNEFLYLD